MIRVLIVDDHPFVRAAIHWVLDGVEGIATVGECSDGSEAAFTAAAVLPDVVLMDVRMPLMPGPVATREVLARQPGVRVLMIAGRLTTTAVRQARHAGAVGYLLKGDPDLLVTAVTIVAAGGTMWPSKNARQPLAH